MVVARSSSSSMRPIRRRWRGGAALVADQLGIIDLVVNNAGMMLAAPLEEHQVEGYATMIDLNLTAAMRIVDAFLDPLLAAARSRGVADLVNISSIGAHLVFPNFAVYCATKAAVTHLSRHLRAELGPKGVRVTNVEPGLVATELQGHVTHEATKAWLDGARTALTWLRPEYIAETIAFAVGQPPHVNLSQVVVFPTAQV